MFSALCLCDSAASSLRASCARSEALREAEPELDSPRQRVLVEVEPRGVVRMDEPLLPVHRTQEDVAAGHFLEDEGHVFRAHRDILLDGGARAHRVPYRVP